MARGFRACRAQIVPHLPQNGTPVSHCATCDLWFRTRLPPRGSAGISPSSPRSHSFYVPVALPQFARPIPSLLATQVPAPCSSSYTLLLDNAQSNKENKSLLLSSLSLLPSRRLSISRRPRRIQTSLDDHDFSGGGAVAVAVPATLRLACSARELALSGFAPRVLRVP